MKTNGIRLFGRVSYTITSAAESKYFDQLNYLGIGGFLQYNFRLNKR
jgi:hypothetical protein